MREQKGLHRAFRNSVGYYQSGTCSFGLFPSPSSTWLVHRLAWALDAILGAGGQETHLEDGRVLDLSWSCHVSPKLPISTLPLHEIEFTPHLFKPLGFSEGGGWMWHPYYSQQWNSSLAQSARCISDDSFTILLLQIPSFGLPSSNV